MPFPRKLIFSLDLFGSKGLIIVTRKEIVWIQGQLSKNFWNMSTIRGRRLLRGQIFFEELLAFDGIEGILAFLDSNMLIAIATT